MWRKYKAWLESFTREKVPFPTDTNKHTTSPEGKRVFWNIEQYGTDLEPKIRL